MNNRTVHASYPGMEIVRYDRAGKWYFEPEDLRLPRQKVTVEEAAVQAVWALENDGEIFFEQRGGSTFDRLVTHRVAEKIPSHRLIW